MTNFMDDISLIDPTAVENTGPLYPVAQWLHGDTKMAAVGGVAHTGGIIIPSKYVADDQAPAPGWTRTNVSFSTGKSETVLAGQKPRLAVIRTRFRWFVNFNGVTTHYPRADYIADSGMRGHVQALCGVHGYDFPVIVTFKGTASREFERLLREFSQKTGEAASRLLRAKDPKARFPRFAFWMRLFPTPHVKIGQKGQESIVTPPGLDIPETLTEDYLSKTYVGRDNLMAYQQIFHDSADWGRAWDKPGAEESHEGGAVDPETGEIIDPIDDPARDAAPAPKAKDTRSDKERWLDFLAEHDLTRTEIKATFGTELVQTWLTRNPGETLDTAMQKVLDRKYPDGPEPPPAQNELF
jgi:hypothetical protein